MEFFCPTKLEHPVSRKENLIRGALLLGELEAWALNNAVSFEHHGDFNKYRLNPELYASD